MNLFLSAIIKNHIAVRSYTFLKRVSDVFNERSEDLTTVV